MNDLNFGFQELISKEEIRLKIEELGRKISLDYKNQDLVLVGVLKGSFIFLADLVRALVIPVELDFIETASYSGTHSSGVVKITKDLKASIENKNVLVVEDIIDTGGTLNYLLDHLIAKRPKSLRVVSLLVKKQKHNMNFPVDYYGFEIGDDFVIGYGMDCNDKYRNLSSIQIYKSR